MAITSIDKEQAQKLNCDGTVDKFTHAKARKLRFCCERTITLESYPLPMLFLLYVVVNNYMCGGKKF